jgi:3-methylfumaryl-CoA hydratase
MPASDTAVRAGRISGTAAAALAGLLGIPAGTILDAGELPPMWHCAQLPDVWPQSGLGPDGHPLAGIPAAPRPGMRRMFAGGRAVHLAPLRIGASAVRRTEVVSRAGKQGRSGPLTFVTVRHTFEQDGRVAVVDDQDIVYRPPASEPAVTPSSRTAGSPWSTTRTLSTGPRRASRLPRTASSPPRPRRLLRPGRGRWRSTRCCCSASRP